MNPNWNCSPQTINSGQNRRLFCRMTLKFARWPWKTIGHLLYATSSFVHHFVGIDVSKLIKVRKRSIRVKFGDFLSRVILKFDRWLWKNNRAPLLCYCNLCASFISRRWWIETGITVRKAQFGSISVIFVPCDLEIWRMTLKNKRAPLLSNIKLYACFYRHILIQTGVTSGNGQMGPWPLWPWTLTSTFCMDITSVGGISLTISGLYDHRNIVKKLWQTDRQTDRRTDGNKCSSSCLVAGKNIDTKHSKIEANRVEMSELWSTETLYCIDWLCSISSLYAIKSSTDLTPIRCQAII